MDIKGIISELKAELLDSLSEFRSFPYVALVALTAIIGIAADSGAEIRVGNACFNTNRDMVTLSESEIALNPEKCVDSNSLD